MPYSISRTFLPVFLLLTVFFAGSTAWGSTSPTPLFGYTELAQEDLGDLPQWLGVQDRHLREDFDRSNRFLSEWLDFLASLTTRPPLEQIQAVNAFANQKRYILDPVNYGVDDYWSIVREFLQNHGDCEDYSITKFFSLRILGFPASDLRLVILQDTNLGIAHAVLAVYLGDDVLILDNQTRQIASHREIVHYVPLFSINETRWWLHVPPVM